MSEAKLLTFQFQGFHYEYDRSAPMSNYLDNKLNVQYGLPKEQGQKTGAVRIKFQINTRDSMAINVSGEAIAEFDLSEFEETIDKELMEKVCWQKAYKTYSERIVAMLKELGTVTGVNTNGSEDTAEK